MDPKAEFFTFLALTGAGLLNSGSLKSESMHAGLACF